MERCVMRIGLVLVLCVAVTGSADSAASTDGISSSPVVQAMQDEMKRTMQRLRLPTMAKPYYAAYTVIDIEHVSVEGSFGAIAKKERDRSRVLKIELRVGDRKLDNSNFLGGPSLWFGAGGIETIALDDDYDAIRREIWLATDEAYKQALETLEAKKAARKGKLKTEEPLGALSQETITTTVVKGRPARLDLDAYAELTRKISAVFRRYSAIQSNKVSVLGSATGRYFVSSEGALAYQPRTIIRIDVTARTQAEDGMPLKSFFSVSARSPQGIPPEKELLERAGAMADQLVYLRSAPVIEDYNGPVLFEGLAAAQVMRALVADNVTGAPMPESDNPQFARIYAKQGALADKLGKRVMPEGFRVEDDPGREYLDDRSMRRDLLGAYQVDDEGIPAQRVLLIDDGILKTLLMSRAPRKEIKKSNGHGRAGLMAAPRALPGNIIVSSKKGLRAASLRKRLIEEAKKAGESQALVVTLLDEPGITGVQPEEAASFMQDMFGGAGHALSAPLVVFRIDAQGKQELVRGARIKPLLIRVLKEIVAWGRDTNVLNYAAVPGGGFSSFVSTAEASVMAAPASVVSPSLLFREIEVAKLTGPFEKLPLLSLPQPQTQPGQPSP